MPRHHVLIGSGPASISAAQTIRAEDSQADITIISAEPEGYYSRPGLAYYLAREEAEHQLYPFTSRELGKLANRTITGWAARVDASARTVTLENGGELGYDRLLLATGSSAVPIGIPGEHLDGVTKLDDLADARDLAERSRRAKAAVVVGGGITALEIVEGLRARGMRVHYFMRKDRYWSNVLSESESRMVERGLADSGVEIHYFTEAAEIVGRNGQVEGVITSDGTLIPCQVVSVAIGVLPQKQLAEQAGLECARGVAVDEYLRSSDPNIFVAGDLAEAPDPRTGKRALEVLWSSAVLKGQTAGHNMVSDELRPYEKDAPLNVTRIGGHKTTIIGTVGSGHDSDLEGVARGDSETWRRLGASSSVEWDVPGTHVRLALAADPEDGVNIVGAVVMGDQSLSFPLQDLIVGRADVSGMASQLAHPRIDLSALVSDFHEDWERARV